jgi:uncharacterized protein
MSEQENVQIVQRIYRAFVAGDLPTVLDLMTDDVELFIVGSAKIPWAGTWRGRQGAEQFIRAVVAASEPQDFTPDEFIAAGESVVVLGHSRVPIRATGRVVEDNWAEVWTLRAGKVNRYRAYSDTAALERGFGGAET